MIRLFLGEIIKFYDNFLVHRARQENPLIREGRRGTCPPVLLAQHGPGKHSVCPCDHTVLFTTKSILLRRKAQQSVDFPLQNGIAIRDAACN